VLWDRLRLQAGLPITASPISINADNNSSGLSYKYFWVKKFQGNFSKEREPKQKKTGQKIGGGCSNQFGRGKNSVEAL